MSTVVPEFGRSVEGHLAARWVISAIWPSRAPQACDLRRVGACVARSRNGPVPISLAAKARLPTKPDSAPMWRQSPFTSISERLWGARKRGCASRPRGVCHRVPPSMGQASCSIRPRRMEVSSLIVGGTPHSILRCASRVVGMKKMATGRGLRPVIPTSSPIAKRRRQIGRCATGSLTRGRRSMTARSAPRSPSSATGSGSSANMPMIGW